MRTKKLTNKRQIEVLEKIAKKSKMDAWFSIDEQGYVRDLEEDGKVLPTKGAIKDLLDGMTPEDCEQLDKDDVYTLIGIFLERS